MIMKSTQHPMKSIMQDRNAVNTKENNSKKRGVPMAHLFLSHSTSYTNSKSICKGTFVTIEISLVIEVFPLALTLTE